MFTGIIEKVLPIKDIKINKGKTFTIDVKDTDYIKDISIGDSISINGVCQTVIEKKNTDLFFYASQETLEITNLDKLNIHDYVNIEKSMMYNGRINGHILSGHIDKKIILKNIINNKSSVVFSFDLPQEDINLIIVKGSIAINGISLTIYNIDINKKNFEVMIIPHTYKNTNLKHIKVSEFANIEFDILGKYINNQLNNIKLRLDNS